MKLDKHGDDFAAIAGISLILNCIPTAFTADQAIWHTEVTKVVLDVEDDELFFDSNELTDLEVWALNGLADEFDLDVIEPSADDETEEDDDREGNSAVFTFSFDRPDEGTSETKLPEEKVAHFKNLTVDQVLELGEAERFLVSQLLKV